MKLYKSLKRTLSLCLALLLCMSVLTPVPVKGAHEQVIYDIISPLERITSGVTLEHVRRFTADGWLNINILSVDLSNPNVRVDVITSQDAAGKPSNTMNLATATGAVAAINASFFNTVKDPVGVVLKSGEFQVADATINSGKNTFASLLINDLNQVLLDYWKPNITLYTPSGKAITVARYNKPHYYMYNDITIQDTRMYTTSLGTNSPQAHPYFTEMVVENGKVKEIRVAKPAVKIPENGFVVIAGGDAKDSKVSDLITKNFKVGDPVKFSISMTPNAEKLKMGLTGGAVLLKDGKIPSGFSHIPEGTTSTNNPRTAVGTSKDGKKLIMVTVDGRQKISTGLTLYDLAVLMKEIGCHNAVNLDGGGSTTMVARKTASTNLEVVNSPSESSLRNVATAIGVFSIAPPGELEGLVIDTVDKNVFVNTSREFTVRGYDKYLNPIYVDRNEVVWSAPEGTGYFEGNRFFPKTEGKVVITASIGNVTGSLELNVLPEPVELDLGVRSLYLGTNQTKVFKITGKSSDGYTADINYKDVEWIVNGEIGEFRDGIFHATGQGTGYVEARVGKGRAFCGVSVPVFIPQVVDDFEKPNGYYYSNLKQIEGKYEISGEQSVSGSHSGKLTYNFPEAETNRASYFYINNGGIKLGGEIRKLGIHAYNDHESSNRLNVEILDAQGRLHYVSLADKLDWTGWKYLELSMSNIPLPATLFSFSVFRTDSSADSGVVYLDNLTLVTSAHKTLDMTMVPQNTRAVDQNYKPTPVYVKTPGSFRFSVFGMASDPGNNLEKTLLAKLADKINKYIEVGAFVGSKGNLAAAGVNKPVVVPNSGYKTFVYENSRFIQLDMSNKSLVLQNNGKRSADQWKWLLGVLSASREDNIFIFLANSPQNFSDSAEAELLQDILTRQHEIFGQNIWVFYGSSTNSSYAKNGVKYVSSAGFDTGSFNEKDTRNAQYMLVVVRGKTITYEYKPIES